MQIVDADFAGLWGVEDSQEPVSVKSRTGYVIMLMGCPLLWVSKLQTQITSSTDKDEVIQNVKRLKSRNAP